jgi:hypothetical protein
MKRHRSVIEQIQNVGEEGWFVPQPCERATDAPPGSLKKIEVLRWRVEHGQELWHPDDRISCDGLDNCHVIVTKQSKIARIYTPRTYRVCNCRNTRCNGGCIHEELV